MKKIKEIMCVIVAVSMILAVGCSDTGSNEEAKFDDSPINLTMFQGSSEGLWYVIATGLTECLNKSYPGSVVQIMPGSSSSNAIRLHNGEADFGMTHTSTTYEAYNGIGQFEAKYDNIRALVSVYPSIAQFAVKDNISFNTFDEFIETKPAIKLNIGQVGSGSYYMFQRMIEFYGYTLEDVEEWGCTITYGGFGQIVDMMSTGAAEGCFITTSAPNKELVQIAANNDVHLVEFNAKALDFMCENYGYVRNYIKDGSYDFASSDFITCATYTMIGVSAQLDDAIAYKMAKSLVENMDYFTTMHGALKNMTTESIFEGLKVPIHPGAEKYYKEAGLMD